MGQVSGEESPNRSAIATAELPHHSFSYDALTVGIGVAIVGATALLYFLTAARDVVVGDTPELITAAVTLGIAHPPGYP
ncbi:MAG TPA: hypothetical protein VNW28_05280, partial [Chthoniobacterales bacterium]|nr:hypothetical protein [Chthoniobacterales bacterium]